MLIPAADPDSPLFEARLGEEMRGEATRDGLRRGSRVTIGKPMVHDLAALWAEAGGLPAEVRGQLARFEFRLLRLACTLHSDPRSAVSWFDLQVALAPEEPGGTEPPVAYDLYPLLIADRVEIERSAAISPRLEFADAAAELGNAALTLRYGRLEPRITAYGKGESAAYWRFSPGAGSAVAPGVKELDLIVRRPRGRGVTATVTVEGRGRSWGVFPRPVTLDDQRFSF